MCASVTVTLAVCVPDSDCQCIDTTGSVVVQVVVVPSPPSGESPVVPVVQYCSSTAVTRELMSIHWHTKVQADKTVPTVGSRVLYNLNHRYTRPSLDLFSVCEAEASQCQY